MDTFTRYLISSLVTFATAFLVAFLPFLDSLTWDQAALFGLLFVGARAGLKAAAEEMLRLLSSAPVPEDLPR